MQNKTEKKIHTAILIAVLFLVVLFLILGEMSQIEEKSGLAGAVGTAQKGVKDVEAVVKDDIIVPLEKAEGIDASKKDTPAKAGSSTKDATESKAGKTPVEAKKPQAPVRDDAPVIKIPAKSEKAATVEEAKKKPADQPEKLSKAKKDTPPQSKPAEVAETSKKTKTEEKPKVTAEIKKDLKELSALEKKLKEGDPALEKALNKRGPELEKAISKVSKTLVDRKKIAPVERSPLANELVPGRFRVGDAGEDIYWLDTCNGKLYMLGEDARWLYCGMVFDNPGPIGTYTCFTRSNNRELVILNTATGSGWVVGFEFDPRGHVKGVAWTALGDPDERSDTVPFSNF